MKIFALTDLHGRRLRDERTAELIKQADLVLIAGDITQFGSDRDAEPIIDDFFRLNSNLLAVSGNCDQPAVNKLLDARKINLHGRTQRFDDLALIGCGGSNPTPFSTPQEYSEREFENLLSAVGTDRPDRHVLLLTHSPPHGTKLDRTFLGAHVGSRAIRTFIERTKPRVVICGHIHEARGIDRLGETVVINPGTFPDHFVVLDVGEKVEYELH